MVTRAIQVATVTLPAVMALIVGVSGGEWIRDVWPARVWLLITLGAVVGTFVIGVTKRAYVLERDHKPRISISDPEQYFMPWLEAQQGNRVNRHFYLKITNKSFGNISKCAVQDAGFENNRGHISPVRGRFFRLRSERGADMTAHAYTRSVDLRGKDDDFDIDICSMDGGEANSRVIMYYATSPTQQYPNAIVRDLFPHYLTVRVTAENMINPETRKFKIYVSDNGELKMEAV